MSKKQDLTAELRQGWVSSSDIMQRFGWRNHTLRGVLSTIKKGGAEIERRRVDGTTSYRIVGGNSQAAA